ncbi:MAG: MgtC/SapB family protein [Hyphomicrobiaceae bacterium]|nr:MAG: MgtC/SapB family protein [Hyphomicrobiaceae bacterium]
MDTFEFIQRLAVALAIGLIIGIERGWKQREEQEGERAAGLRTLALAGLLGGVWGGLARALGDWGVVALGFAFAVFTAGIVVFRLRELEHAKSYGATTAVAAMLAFSLGAFAMVDMVAAAAAAVATATLLALKTMLHAWLKRLTWEELRAGLVLLAMTVILLPILPNREVGPLGAINPHEIWLMTITIAAMSFAGYVAIRFAGSERGVVLSGLAGGLVSSTVVTLTMAKLAHDHPERQRLCASASLLSSTVMAVRVLVVASVFNFALARWLLPPLAAAVFVQFLFSGMLLRWGLDADKAMLQPLELKNPFDLGVVLGFGALLTVVMVLAKALTLWTGTTSVLALGAASGIADVDAITLSMARLARADLSVETAALAVLLALAVNSVSKVVLGTMTGGRAFGAMLGAGTALAVAAALGALWLAASWLQASQGS